MVYITFKPVASAIADPTIFQYIFCIVKRSGTPEPVDVDPMDPMSPIPMPDISMMAKI